MKTLRALTLLFALTATAVFSALAGEESRGLSPESGPGASGPLAITPEAPASDESQTWRDKVAVIPIEGVIIGKPMSEMPDQVIAALERADRENARLIVLEIDSPGGEVGICDTMSRRIFESRTPVVALVIHKAVSGGAMIASAARELVMTRAARIGDIQPMQASIGGSNVEMDARTAEKIEVDIRTIMKVFAENHGRPSAVFAAMVSRSMALYQVTLEDGKILYLDGHELGLHEENYEKGRERRKIVATRIIKPEGKLLELTAQQAAEFGVASEVVDSAADFYRERGIDDDDIVRPEIVKGSFEFKNLLPSLDDLGLPLWVMVLLGVFLIVGIAGIVTEFHAPGTGIPAAIGIIGFVCFFATLVMHDRGSPVGIVVFLLGVALLVVEIMVLPGFGVAGVLGILGILGGLFLAFTPDWESEYMRTFMWAEVGSFTILLLVALVATVFLIWLIAAHGARLPFISFFTLQQSQTPGSNPYPEATPSEDSASARTRARSLVGQTGVAETMLRPAGKVRLDSGELLDVVTDGGFVEPGSRVRVLEAAPGRIVVGEERP